jgi:hypothetical protein
MRAFLPCGVRCPHLGRQQGCAAVRPRRNHVSVLTRSLPTPATEVISDADTARLEELRELFRAADLDG